MSRTYNEVFVGGSLHFHNREDGFPFLSALRIPAIARNYVGRHATRSRVKRRFQETGQDARFDSFLVRAPGPSNVARNAKRKDRAALLDTPVIPLFTLGIRAFARDGRDQSRVFPARPAASIAADRFLYQRPIIKQFRGERRPYRQN